MIGMAKQDGSNSVAVYDESGNFMFGLTGELVGFTGSTVVVRDGSSTNVYDESGSFLYSK